MKLAQTRRVDQGLGHSILVGFVTALLVVVFLSLIPAQGMENILKCWCGAVCAYAVMVGMIALHRPQFPTRFDCHVCSAGFLILFVVSVIAFYAVWIWRGLL